MALRNNVLFYIKQHISCAKSNGLYQGCKLIFTNVQIEESRRLLLDMCLTQLAEICPDTKEKVGKPTVIRKSSQNRSKIDTELSDIISTISAFSMAGRDLDLAKNEGDYTPNMDVNPELLNPFALLEKVGEGVKQSNALMKAIDDLMQNYTALQTDFTELKKQVNLSTTCVCTANVVVPTPDTDTSPSPSPVSLPLGPGEIPLAKPLTSTTNTSSPLLKRSHSENDLSKINTDFILSPINKTPSPTAIDTAGTRPPPRPKTISGKDRHLMNLAITEAALDANNFAKDQGKDNAVAKMAGKAAATAVAKTIFTYATAAKVNRPHVKHTPMQAPTRQHTQSPPTRIGYVPAKPSSYKRGNASPMNTGSIAFKYIRPAHLDNKCLAVSRIDRNISKTQCREYINEIAKKEINILFLKELS